MFSPEIQLVQKHSFVSPKNTDTKYKTKVKEHCQNVYIQKYVHGNHVYLNGRNFDKFALQELRNAKNILYLWIGDAYQVQVLHFLMKKVV